MKILIIFGRELIDEQDLKFCDFGVKKVNLNNLVLGHYASEFISRFLVGLEWIGGVTTHILNYLAVLDLLQLF